MSARDDWPGRARGVRSRQWPALIALADRVAASETLEGLVLIGSFASGTPDELSDIDVIAVAMAGRFDAAWAERHRLSEEALAAWDLRPKPGYQVHNWLTRDLVKVDCTIVDPDLGSKDLAEPFVVLVGTPSVADRFPRGTLETVRERARQISEEQERQRVDPATMDYGELIDWKIAELKSAVRRAPRR
ncbi:MAG: hypothetical protein ABR583_08570 [Gaiellaceae bacterium]